MKVKLLRKMLLMWPYRRTTLKYLLLKKFSSGVAGLNFFNNKYIIYTLN